jgi:hypothetical protein
MRRGCTLKVTLPPPSISLNTAECQSEGPRLRSTTPGTSGDPPPSPGPPAGLPHFEFRRRSSRAPAKAATTPHRVKCAPNIISRTSPSLSYPPPPEPALPARPSRGGRHGSFLPCPPSVRSRGSPNFLQAILKLMHVSINSGRCMHRSGQRSRVGATAINGQRKRGRRVHR